MCPRRLAGLISNQLGEPESVKVGGSSGSYVLSMTYLSTTECITVAELPLKNTYSERFSVSNSDLDEHLPTIETKCAPWFALFVRTKFERAVERSLRDKGYETYLALQRQERHWADRVKIREVPLFANYVFCRFDLDKRGEVLKTPEVQFVIGSGKYPTPIPEHEIEAVRRVVLYGSAVESCGVEEGEAVVVVSGPLTGLEGVVVKSKNRHRLVVNLVLLQRGVATEIDRSAVRSLTGPRGFSVAAARELNRSFVNEAPRGI